MIDIEVVYAMPERQKLVRLSVTASTTALDAAKQSGLDEEFEGLNYDTTPMGIYGKAIVPSAHIMKHGERLELYRPLIADPKLRRKRRAAS